MSTPPLKVYPHQIVQVAQFKDYLSKELDDKAQYSKDKSLYWTPRLYFLHANGQYEPVPTGGTVVYYLGRGTDNWGNSTAIPFPPGLKMISGDNNARTLDNTTMTFGNSTYPGRLVSDRVKMACINFTSTAPFETPGFPPRPNDVTICPQGLRAELQMQSCWNGKDLDSPDHMSHVAYLSQIDNGICPPTHPYLFPHLFYEVLYDVAHFDGQPGEIVFSNGDLTGYAFHGDFINAWDNEVLQEAINACLIGNPDGVIAECAPLAASNRDDKDKICPRQTPVFPCEPVDGLLPKLPGCITPTGEGEVANSTCPGGNHADCAPDYNTHNPLPFQGNDQYKLLGCYTEGSNSRALTTKSTVDAANMTGANCIQFCGGSKYVGVEYSQECYCGDELQAGAVPAADGDCDMDCTGDEFEICGGPSRLNIFMSTNPHVNDKLLDPPTIGNYANHGCWTDSPGARGLTAPGLFGNDANPMSLEKCAAFCAPHIFFGVEFGQECYCGDTLQSTSTLADPLDCSMTCPGNTTEFCGNGNRLNVYSLVSTSSNATSSATSSTASSTSASSTISTSSSSTSSDSSTSTAVNSVVPTTLFTASSTASV